MEKGQIFVNNGLREFSDYEPCLQGRTETLYRRMDISEIPQEGDMGVFSRGKRGFVIRPLFIKKDGTVHEAQNPFYCLRAIGHKRFPKKAEIQNYLEFKIMCDVSRSWYKEKEILNYGKKGEQPIIDAFLEIKSEGYGVQNSVKLKDGLVDLLTDFGVKTKFKVEIGRKKYIYGIFAFCKIKFQFDENIKLDELFRSLKSFGKETEQVIRSAYIDQQKNIDSNCAIYY